MTRNLSINRTKPCIEFIRSRLDDQKIGRKLYRLSSFCDKIVVYMMTKLTDEEMQYVISHLSIGYTPKYPDSFMENVEEMVISFKLRKK